MGDTHETKETDTLKKQILDNVAVNDQVVCGFCDELIAVAEKNHDWQSVAFGYVWRADYFCYVESDLKAVSRELYHAQTYIDEKKPRELLEKYYTLRHVLYEQCYDMQSAFQYSLKALEVAEELELQHRVGANYGNIATYYLDYRCYEEALLHTTHALEVFRVLPEKKPRIMRILLCNLIKICLKMGKKELARQTIEELQVLPIEQTDLQIYVDYGYMMYYSALQDAKNSVAHQNAMFRNGLAEFPNRAYVFEFLTEGLEAMIQLGEKKEAERLLMFLENYIKEDEINPSLELCGLKIRYSRRFQTGEECASSYKEYYHLYTRAQEQVHQLKADGLRAGVELNEVSLQCEQSRRELDELYDLVNYDGLTRVYNRHYFNVRLDEILNSSGRVCIGFAMVDVDYFKEYNDFYGHAAGDEVLKKVALCLMECGGDHTIVARHGGDEFVCMSWEEDCAYMAEYLEMAVAMLREEKMEHIQSHCSEQVTLSIGYGYKPVSNKIEVVTLFDEVDEALYAVKRSGRNGIKSIAVPDPKKEEI